MCSVTQRSASRSSAPEALRRQSSFAALASRHTTCVCLRSPPIPNGRSGHDSNTVALASTTGEGQVCAQKAAAKQHGPHIPAAT